MKYGFSLVELSIVLVILGLLVGGILTGQNLIRAAELRSITKEFQNFEAAVNIFKDKYFALPGDMPNATAFWGLSGNCPGTHSQGTTDGTTCDGDGNGSVDWSGDHLSPTRSETFRFWQHLANAGLIEGSYDGVSARTSSPYVFAFWPDNAPVSKIGSNVVWGVFDVDGSTSRFNYDDFGPYSYVLGVPPSVGEWNRGAMLTAEEAWNIDTKMDDGMPGRGRVLGNVSIECVGTTDQTAYDVEYNLGGDGIACRLDFHL